MPDNNGLFNTFSIFQEINQNAVRLPTERQAPGVGRQATAVPRRRSSSNSDYDLTQRPRMRRRRRRRHPRIDLPVEQQPAFLRKDRRFKSDYNLQYHDEPCVECGVLLPKRHKNWKFSIPDHQY
ncbi:MAG: hypothetical protein ABSA33_05630, partial [Candidatus Micrarchaeaceae archaeon]